MPRFDGTGPNGNGPLSGRGMGRCQQSGGFGRGNGRGICRRFFSLNNSLNQEEQAENLNNYKEELEKELELVTEKLKK